LFSLYEGGVFDTTKDSVKLLILGVNQFRRLTPEDLKEIREEEKAEEKMLEEAISEESEKNS
jgi:hypothetical protein